MLGMKLGTNLLFLNYFPIPKVQPQTRVPLELDRVDDAYTQSRGGENKLKSELQKTNNVTTNTRMPRQPLRTHADKLQGVRVREEPADAPYHQHYTRYQ